HHPRPTLFPYTTLFRSLDLPVELPRPRGGPDGSGLVLGARLDLQREDAHAAQGVERGPLALGLQHAAHQRSIILLSFISELRHSNPRTPVPSTQDTGRVAAPPYPLHWGGKSGESPLPVYGVRGTGFH